MASDRPPDKARPVVLMVDDNPINLEELADVLGDAGFRTLRAENGPAALEQALAHAPNVILLDVMMPGMDGFALCDVLKNRAETSAIPVLFMTALNATDDKLTGFRLGAVDYITKPFQHQEVVARITTQVRMQQLATELREKEARLSQMFANAMDAVVAMDELRVIRMFNGAAEKMFRCKAPEVIGRPFDRFLPPELRRVVVDYQEKASPFAPSASVIWAPEGLNAVRADGEEFPLEGSIARTEAAGSPVYTLILRDLNERKARQKAEAESDRLRGLNLYLEEELRAANEAGDFVGKSSRLRDVLDLVKQVAGTDATVFVTGETGTGKELVARALHKLSRRESKALIKLNCAAIPSNLAESELFGHEKGAFTGALSRKPGRFELADGGTLFLDEIGELSLDMQAKLLRVLQEGEFERVGGTHTLRCDVRLIAATNRDLLQLSREGKFRTDLYYRLNVFPIALPPLRDRKEDIPALAGHFTQEYAAKMGKRITSIGPRMLTALQLYSWPGNIRELRHVIERAVILTRGDELASIDWGPAEQGPAEHTAPATLDEAERAHILKVLAATAWRVAGPHGAAEILGVPSTTLRSRMQKLGIKKSQTPPQSHPG